MVSVAKTSVTAAVILLLSVCRLAHALWGCSVGEQCSPEMDTISLQALSNQQKAVLMSERVMGIEHPNTIQEYVSSHAGVGM